MNVIREKSLELTDIPSSSQHTATPPYDSTSRAIPPAPHDPESQDLGLPSSADRDDGDAIGLLDGNFVRRSLLAVPPIPTWLWPAATAACLLVVLLLGTYALHVADSASISSQRAATLSKALVSSRLNQV